MQTATALAIDHTEQGASEPVVRRRILIVDDVADNREILRRRLERRDFDTCEVDGGQAAIDFLDRESVDLVLLDIMMPEVNGHHVLRHIRSRWTSAELPVLMVSAKSQSEDVVDCLKEGADDYITKPVDFPVALARINAQISRLEALEEERRATQANLETETQARQRSEQELEYLAYHDSLTGLLNRRAFDDRMEACVLDSTADASVLMFFDLDGFKAVNDLHGHRVGDEVLVQAAERIVSTLGEGATIARLGGDEFAAIVHGLDDMAAFKAQAQAVCDAIAVPFTVYQAVCQIGASCGVARTGATVPDLAYLMRAADIAMYCAKDAGRGQVILFEASMMEAHDERVLLENDLKIAVATGAMNILYQPLIDVHSGKVRAFEALLRWPHETRGIISPEVFIPIAEDSGLMSTLGDWVIREACKEAAGWEDGIMIAINLSPVQLAHPGLVPNLINAMATAGIDPSRVELEITENALMTGEPETLRTLERLRELGVTIALDDFGTGYSSFAYLQQFKFDTIKIDKSFIEGLTDANQGVPLIDAILSLSKNLGVETTVEGIETPAQYAFAQRMQCTNAQGYFFSRPLHRADALNFIRSHNDAVELRQA